jgi:uncharacterized protein YqeY
MPIKEDIQNAIKDAMRNKDSFRLECLRMAKGALLLKEKESSSGLTDEAAIATLRAEAKKRHQTAETFRELGKEDEAVKSEQEAVIIEEFLPRQLTPEDLESRVRAYLAEHPEINHAGKLTGAMKKELGDQADGKLLNEICGKVLG